MGMERYSFGMRCVAAAVFFVASLSSALHSFAEEMPQISGQSLANKQIDFPSVCGGSVCIIVIGFSHASQSQVKAWTDRANSEFHDHPHVAIYSMAVLEDAPRLVRGMAVHGIRSSVPAAQHDHFVIVYQGEAGLKRVVAFQKPDDAYILLLDRTGQINWTTRGSPSDASSEDLRKHISSLEGK